MSVELIKAPTCKWSSVSAMSFSTWPNSGKSAIKECSIFTLLRVTKGYNHLDISCNSLPTLVSIYTTHYELQMIYITKDSLPNTEPFWKAPLVMKAICIKGFYYNYYFIYNPMFIVIVHKCHISEKTQLVRAATAHVVKPTQLTRWGQYNVLSTAVIGSLWHLGIFYHRSQVF